MTLSLNNLTFIIVTFKSEHIIHECIESLPKNSEIILIDNSNNNDMKNDLEKKYNKIRVIVQKNEGMGSANNKGIKLCKTDYAFVINPDVKFYKNTIQALIDFSSKNIDYAVIAPISDNLRYPNYKITSKNVLESADDHLSVDSVDGFAMLINKNKFKDNIYFDENFFLYLENDDLCLRIKKENHNIFIIKNSQINHKGSISRNADLELLRNWHWMWSKYYFNKKHYGTLIALIKVSPNFLSAIFKYLINLVIFNNYKRKIYKMRILGLYNSIIGKKSWYRLK